MAKFHKAHRVADFLPALFILVTIWHSRVAHAEGDCLDAGEAMRKGTEESESARKTTDLKERKSKAKKALDLFLCVYNKDPENIEALVKLGSMELLQEQYLEAYQHFSAALEHADDPYVLGNRKGIEHDRSKAGGHLVQLKVHVYDARDRQRRNAGQAAQELSAGSVTISSESPLTAQSNQATKSPIVLGQFQLPMSTYARPFFGGPFKLDLTVPGYPAATQYRFLESCAMKGGAAASCTMSPYDQDIFLQKTPFYKKWWFWALVGGGVTGLAVGLGVGLGIDRSPIVHVP